MNKLVLIADDYDHAAEGLAELLMDAAGCATICVHNGEQAIAQARLQRPDVAILDIDMPKVDGLQAARAIRAMYAEHPPILVACTGNPFSDELAQTHQFHLILQKPLNVAQILRVIAMD